MITELIIPKNILCQIKDHLMPDNQEVEEAAFIFVQEQLENDHLTLKYANHRLLAESDFEVQSAYFISVKHEILSEVIKLAFSKDYSIVEVHSHLGQKQVCFSPSDYEGFKEVVPYFMWRLQGRCYGSIVCSEGGFDALIWQDSGKRPIVLNSIIAQNEVFTPTNLSIDRFYNEE